MQKSFSEISILEGGRKITATLLLAKMEVLRKSLMTEKGELGKGNHFKQRKLEKRKLCLTAKILLHLVTNNGEINWTHFYLFY